MVGEVQEIVWESKARPSKINRAQRQCIIIGLTVWLRKSPSGLSKSLSRRFSEEPCCVTWEQAVANLPVQGNNPVSPGAPTVRKLVHLKLAKSDARKNRGSISGVCSKAGAIVYLAARPAKEENSICASGTNNSVSSTKTQRIQLVPALLLTVFS